jgi:hypothetical protein
MQKGSSEGGRRDLISHSHAWIWMAVPGKPSARLTYHLKLVTRQRFLRFSILKETPATPQAFLVPLCPIKNVGHSQQDWGRGKGEGASMTKRLNTFVLVGRWFVFFGRSIGLQTPGYHIVQRGLQVDISVNG